MAKKIRKRDLPKLKYEYRNKKILLIETISSFALIMLGLVFIMYSEINVVGYINDNDKTNYQIKEIASIVKIEEVYPKEEELEPVTKEEEIVKEDYYWDYIKLPLISVNFKELKEKNNDTVAFLKVNGTNINYPVVKTTDNSYYLTHSYDKSYNAAGWVFMDYRNQLDELSDNTIIYAHGMHNKTMFGSLKDVLTDEWYNNPDNYVVNISTEKLNTLWQVFSVYEIETETYYLTSNFGTVESHEEFIDTIKNRSKYTFNTTVSPTDKILTLSTCKNDNVKIVLHAKLIKKQVRN